MHERPPAGRRRASPRVPARSSLARALLVGALACLSPRATALPHGGVYRGPGAGVPPSGASSAPALVTPTAPPGAPTGDLTDWQTWWAFNREPWLELKRALYEPVVRTGGDDFGIGRGESAATEPSARPSLETVRDRVVPALARTLREGTDDDVRSGALLALAKVGIGPGGADLGDLFRPLLADASQEIAETAAVALGVTADARHASALTSLLADVPAGRELCGRNPVPTRTRAFAAYGLGLIGAGNASPDVRRYVVHHLLRALDEPDGATRDVPVACVIALGLVPLDDDARRSRTAPPADDAVQPGASRAGQIEFLLALCTEKERHPVVRGYAPVALARLVEDRDDALRARAVAALVGLLARDAKTPDVVRQGVVDALARLADDDADEHDRAARVALRALAEGDDRMLRNGSVLALARVAARPGAGPAPGADDEVTAARVRELLLRKLARAQTAERPWAALALGVLERPRQERGLATPAAVLEALRTARRENQGPLERGAHALAAGMVRDLTARDELVELALDGSDDAARGHACVALGLAGLGETAETLRGIVREARYRPSVMLDASTGLGLLGDRTLLPELLAMLAEAKGLAATAAITQAIGRIGDRRAVEPLVLMLEAPETNARTRAFAAVALGIVCDKELLPWNAKLAVDANYRLAPTTLFDPGTGKGILDLL